MISQNTLKDLHAEIAKIDEAIQACQDQYGNCPPWMSHRLSTLVELRESFWASIKHLESYNVVGV